MNEKLREAFLAWRDGDVRYTPEWQADAHKGWEQACCMLYAAARGEVPGFQLVPNPPTKKMMRPNDDWCDFVTNARIYCAMLAASKEEFK